MHPRWNEGGRALLLTLVGAMAGREIVQRLRQADLSGEVALITGGSRGLGLLLARELAAEGCRIVICARDEEDLARAREDLEQRGAQVLAVPCDVTDREQVGRMVAEAERTFGPVDLLVNNAGIIQAGPEPTTTLADYEQAMGIMFWGVVYPTLAVLPKMRERRHGRIVNITSIGGKVSIPHLLPYSSAKFAAVGFSEGLRAELARDGITVTTIAPGLMRTGSHLNALFAGQQEIEFALFAPLASLPFISIDAERAARQIVRATKRGESERILTIPANLLARFHGLFPGLTADLLGLANRFLPTGTAKQKARGIEVQERIDSSLLERVTSWGIDAAERFNQLGTIEPDEDGQSAGHNS